MHKDPCVYILTNEYRTVLYTGVTSDIQNRLEEHILLKDEVSFSSRYNLIHLVFYRYFEDMESAIAFEKLLKRSGRKRKETLIGEMNPEWKDLSDEIRI